MENLQQHLATIETQLGYVFNQKEHLVLAFTHPSFFNEHRATLSGHNERMEFLGDSILGLIVSEYLYTHLPTESEGHLSHLKAHLVGATICAQYLHKLELEKFLLLGKGEAVNTGRGRERIIADLFEAIIGAIYIDGGLVAVKHVFLSHFSPYLDEAMENPSRNWKAELQDYSQKKFQKPPEYQLLEELGPAHSKTFLISVLLDGVEIAKGEGGSKKTAEQEAARNALHLITQEEEDGKN